MRQRELLKMITVLGVSVLTGLLTACATDSQPLPVTKAAHQGPLTVQQRVFHSGGRNYQFCRHDSNQLQEKKNDVEKT